MFLFTVRHYIITQKIQCKWETAAPDDKMRVIRCKQPCRYSVMKLYRGYPGAREANSLTAVIVTFRLLYTIEACLD
jgi:hypothetical protein